MAEVTITTEPRTEFGKGAARRFRRDHKVPGVIYGHGGDPRHVTLPGHDLMLALKGGANTLLRLTGAVDELVLPRQVVRDPIKGFYEHIDLLVVRRGEKVTVDIPVVLVGEPPRTGVLDQQASTLSIEAEATHIPHQVEVSIEGLEVGSAIHAGSVTLPEGSALIGDPDAIVVHVLAPTVERTEGEAAEGAEGSVEGETGEETAGVAEGAASAEAAEAAEAGTEG